MSASYQQCHLPGATRPSGAGSCCLVMPASTECKWRFDRSRRRDACWRSYTEVMSVVEWPEEPGLMVLSPKQALERARPLPDADALAIEGLSVEEWQALQDALSEA